MLAATSAAATAASYAPKTALTTAKLGVKGYEKAHSIWNWLPYFHTAGYTSQEELDAIYEDPKDKK